MIDSHDILKVDIFKNGKTEKENLFTSDKML